jgi:hypothetical protein
MVAHISRQTTYMLPDVVASCHVDSPRVGTGSSLQLTEVLDWKLDTPFVPQLPPHPAYPIPQLNLPADQHVHPYLMDDTDRDRAALVTDEVRTLIRPVEPVLALQETERLDRARDEVTRIARS